MKKVLYTLIFCAGPLFAQGIENGEISGNFQSNSQIYYEDADLGISSENLPDERFLTNSFANIIYATRNFSTGMRYEANQNSLLGFDKRYNGEG
ncbi:MAG: DUF6029 family protein, partial [Flavobacteriales bacterium]|nr:DUF6029 family protein [Flavobacteriales bacterium]